MSTLDGSPNAPPSTDDRTARPVVHFTPPEGWLNDPNGLISVDGQHHMFYQHNPAATMWGPMHWGHAVSSDFITWRDLPIALTPDELGMIFSGSAVVDIANTAGFGAGALVSVFTYHLDDGQSQALAWSHDGGRTFTKYDGNPVIPSVAERPLCRDPKVFWSTTGPIEHWVMVLAAGHEIWIYTSDDLRTWHRSDILAGFDLAVGPLETPDLFELTADDGTTHWVLTLGAGDGAPAGGSGTAVQVGDFDGARFTPRGEPSWVDHGSDFYAAQSWNDMADGRRVWIAWMGNWAHDRTPGPQAHWRGQMSIPRELALLAFPDGGYRLGQTPVRELSDHRLPGHVEQAVVITPDGYHPDVHGRALDIALTGVEPPRGSLDVVCSRGSERIVVTVALADGSIAVNHPPPRAGPVRVPSRRAHRAEIPAGAGRLEVRVVLDATSIEVLCGVAAISDVLDPDDAPWTVALACSSRELVIDALHIHPLHTPDRPTTDHRGQ